MTFLLGWDTQGCSHTGRRWVGRPPGRNFKRLALGIISSIPPGTLLAKAIQYQRYIFVIPRPCFCRKIAKNGITDFVFNENTNNPSPVIILFAYFTRHSFCASYIPGHCKLKAIIYVKITTSKHSL